MKSSLAILVLLLAALTASGSTFVVTNKNDSGPGSLRQAIVDANSDTNAPTVINFSIPGSGVQTIKLATSLPTISGPLTIDGYTQPGARPNSKATGTDAVLLIEISGQQVGGTGLTLADSNNIVRGLVINGFATDISIQGQSHLVSGCYLGASIGGSAAIARPAFGDSISINPLANSITIGGTTPAHRNVIAGNISFSHCTALVVQGNYIGVSADGISFIAPSAVVSGQANGVTIGGNTSSAGNVIAGRVSFVNSDSPLVQKNWIGTNASGKVASPGAEGLSLVGETGVGTLGFTSNGLISQNVIVRSINSALGTVFLSGATNNTFKANLIGGAVDHTQYPPAHTHLGNASVGFELKERCSGNQIGGTVLGDGNTIGYRGNLQQFSAGVAVRSTANAPAGFANGPNFINRNLILGNIGLPIDLAEEGMTPNDIGDSDGFQNSPRITSVVFDRERQIVRVAGFLESAANTTFTIEFFAHFPMRPLPWRYSYGFWNVTTDANGHASFDAIMHDIGGFPPFSATATGPMGTSEHSPVFTRQLLNISTRAKVGTGDDTLIGGFIISGTEAKKVLLRGIGSSLKVNGVAMQGRLEDPVIQLFDSSGTLLGGNNDWADSQQAIIEETGLAPADPQESALLVHLSPGAYTLHLRGSNGATGIGLVEIYDLAPQSSHLANISTRARVETGDNVVIGGFIMAPSERPPPRVLIRGLGPSLTGVPNPLQDPMIELRDTNGMVLASNDDWRANATDVAETGLPPTNDREAALVWSFGASNYTVILRGKNNTTGAGLIEIYHLP